MRTLKDWLKDLGVLSCAAAAVILLYVVMAVTQSVYGCQSFYLWYTHPDSKKWIHSDVLYSTPKDCEEEARPMRRAKRDFDPGGRAMCLPFGAKP